MQGWMRIRSARSGRLRGLCPDCWRGAIPEIRAEQARMLTIARPFR
jgi:hypothetical protein